uniref:Uncharacterized protein n=1 Tax=Anguilla anguilla TaxID=7936 RepID=A0A0E9QXB0_ANGAN
MAVSYPRIKYVFFVTSLVP